MDGRRNFPPDPDADSRWYPDDRDYEDRGYDERGYGDRRDDRSRGARARDEAERDFGEDGGYGDDRGYRDERGYTPTRYADERNYDDRYRVPEPRGGGRGYDADSPSYGEEPSGQFAASASRAADRYDSGELSGEFGSRYRRSEALDRSALQRPVSGGAPSGHSSVPGLAETSGLSAVPGVPVSELPGAQLGPAPMSAPAQPGAAGGPVPGGPVPGLPLSGGAVPGGPVPGGPMPSGPVSSGAMPAGPVSSGPTGAPPSAFVAPTALTAAITPSQAGAGQGADLGGAVYRSKRPGLAVVLVLLTIVFELPVLRLFLSAVTASKVEAARVSTGRSASAGARSASRQAAPAARISSNRASALVPRNGRRSSPNMAWASRCTESGA